GMVMSLILLAPSWGGMINGMMTLSGAWHKLRDDPILRFLVVSLAFYGMSTFEGPMMAIKTVNALSHYTDWTIGHVIQRRATACGGRRKTQPTVRDGLTTTFAVEKRSEEARLFPRAKAKPLVIADQGFWDRSLTMTYSHMGRPHTT
ncbi:cbb3-type cytochrome c oxidase subunit I, partial [Pseudomonas aeruginosa]|uniref:cbb3-type cytochrome c oxidase subunit I n=1 Tax=Pseudomonas aeruginosa TaxID=287 RepID=UPI00280C5392